MRAFSPAESDVVTLPGGEEITRTLARKRVDWERKELERTIKRGAWFAASRCAVRLQSLCEALAGF